MGVEEDAEFFRRLDPAMVSPTPTPSVVPGKPAPMSKVDQDAEFFRNIHNGVSAYNAGTSVQNPNTIPPTTPPVKHYSNWETAKGFATNLPRDLADFGSGVWHAMVHPVETAKKLANITGAVGVGLDKSLAGTFLNQLSPDVKKMILEDHPEAAVVLGDAVTLNNAVNAAKAIGGEMAYRYGGIDNIKQSLHDHPARTLADLVSLPGVGTGLRAGAVAAGKLPGYTGYAARGLAEGGRAVVAPTQALNDLTNAALTKAVPKVANYVDTVMHPTNALIGAEAEKPLALRNALFKAVQRTGNPAPSAFDLFPGPQTRGEIIQGSIPNAGQAVQPATDSTRWAALVKRAQELKPTEFARIQSAQNDANLAQIRRFGRDPQELLDAFNAQPKTVEEAQGMHKAMRSAEYGAANQVISKMNPEIQRILDTPFGQMALKEAMKGSSQAEEPFFLGRHVPAQPAVPAHWGTDPYGQNLWIPEVPAQPEQFTNITGKNLQRIKEEFDALIYGKPTEGGAMERALTPNQAAEAKKTRDELVRVIGQMNPTWQDAREAYATRAKIINRMNLGDILEKSLTDKLLGDETGTLRAQNFASAVQDAPVQVNSTVRQVMGKPRVRTVEEIASDQENEIIRKILQDQARNAQWHQRASQAGGEFKGNLDTAISDAIGFKPGGVPGRVINALASPINKNIAENVATMVQTPEGALELVNNYLMHEIYRKAMGKGYKLGYNRINALVNPYKYMNEYPAIYNLLEAKQPTSNDKEKQK